MAFRLCYWTDDAILYIAEHDISMEEFEAVVTNPYWEGFSKSSGMPAAKGYVNGRHLFCLYEIMDETYILPFNAYEIQG